MDLGYFTEEKFAPCHLLNYKGISVDQLHFDFRGLRYDAASDQDVGTHVHDFYELQYVFGGEIETTVNGVTRVCGPGRFYLITPMSLHSHACVKSRSNMYRGFTVRWRFRRVDSDQFNPDLEQSYLNLLNAPFTIFPDDRYVMAQDLIDRIELCRRAQTATVPLLHLVRMILRVSEFCACKSNNKLDDLPRIRDKAHDHLMASIDYINKHLGERISAADVADHVFVSYSHLERLYMHYLNTSINVYINRVKMDRAIHLLLSTDLSVRAVAKATGFSSPSYFTNTFKEHFGQPPKWFRAYYNDKRYFKDDPALL